MSNFEIFMLVCLGLMFLMFMSLLIGGIIAHERTIKKFLARNLAEYEALSKDKTNNREPFIYKDDATLYYENLLRQKKLEKDLKKKIEKLKREEDEFKFIVNRSG